MESLLISLFIAVIQSTALKPDQPLPAPQKPQLEAPQQLEVTIIVPCIHEVRTNP